MLSTLEWAITVFNASGNTHLYPVADYGPSEKISVFEATVFNASGELIKKFKNSEIQDVHAVMQGSVFIDYRVRHVEYTPTQYPYTFVFKMIKKSKNTAFIPQWMPIGYYYQSVEQSSIQLSYPEEWTLRASEKNFERYSVNKINKSGYYYADINSQPALVPEYLSTSQQHFLPNCRLSLNHISLEGIHGKVDNWFDFGNWYRDNMLSSASQLSVKTKQELFELTSGITDPVIKARLVYEYMQSRTRYVNVSIGIGGWKPMPVAEVDRLGYGDCKALSYYTVALLDAVGVPAAYSIVYAGTETRSIDTSLYSVQGNHVIVHIPLPDTSLWLETTDQQIPFGYLGSFTDNRHAISMQKNTTQLIKTTAYPDSANVQLTESNVTIDSNGGLWASTTIRSNGLMYGKRSHLLLSKQEDREMFYRNEWGHLQALKFGNLMLEADKSKVVINEQLELTALVYGTISGNRMFVIPNVFSRTISIPPKYAQRKLPFEIQRGYLTKDVVLVEIPEGYTIESIPKDKEISGLFGYYKTSVTSDESQQRLLKYERILYIKSGRHQPEVYDHYYQFIRDASRHDIVPVVLIKSNP